MCDQDAYLLFVLEKLQLGTDYIIDCSTVGMTYHFFHAPFDNSNYFPFEFCQNRENTSCLTIFLSQNSDALPFLRCMKLTHTVNPDKLNQLTLNVGTVLRQCK